MDIRLTWTDCDETGDYVVPNVLSPRDLALRPENMDETVLLTQCHYNFTNVVHNIIHSGINASEFVLAKSKIIDT